MNVTALIVGGLGGWTVLAAAGASVPHRLHRRPAWTPVPELTDPPLFVNLMTELPPVPPPSPRWLRRVLDDAWLTPETINELLRDIETREEWPA